MSFPTVTLQEIKIVHNMPYPAITICPKPTFSDLPPGFVNPDISSYIDWLAMRESTIAEDFNKSFISLFDLITKTPVGGPRTPQWTKIGEIIHIQGEHLGTTRWEKDPNKRPPSIHL